MAPISFIDILQKRHGGGGTGGEAAAASSSGGSDKGLTITALIVSAFALIATIGQLLQQYVATADGYRRCGKSVMGPWGRKTTLRWRWREFRFECLYCVPFVDYILPQKHPNGARTLRRFCDEPDLTTFDPNPPERKRRDWNAELAGWVHLLHYLGLHDEHVRQSVNPVSIHEEKKMAYHDWLRCAHVEIACRSWDFLPDDVLRPLAITTLAGLTATTRRLGMSWKQFEPNMGTLQAEGNHQVITSTVIRGMGIIIHYIRDPILDSEVLCQKHLHDTSSLSQADELLFGRVGHTDMFNIHKSLPHLVLHTSTFVDVASTLPALFSDPTTAETLVSILRTRNEAADKNGMEPINDIVPFLTPFLGMSPDVRPIIPWPNTSSRGMTHTAFRPFEDELIALIDRRGSEYTSATSRAILAFYQSLERRFNRPPGRPESSSFSWTVPKLTFKTEMLVSDPADTQAIYNVMIACEDILHSSPIVLAGKYHVLVAQHIFISAHIDSTTTDTEKMKRMFATLPEMARAVKSEWPDGGAVEAVTSASDVELVAQPSAMQAEDAWLAMMLRAMCWQRLHIVQPGMPLPIEYSRSMLPVFIT